MHVTNEKTAVLGLSSSVSVEKIKNNIPNRSPNHYVIWALLITVILTFMYN